MNRYTKLALATATGALLFLATSSTLARPSLMKLTSNGAPIFTLSITTPNDQPMKVYNVIESAGTTCDNMPVLYNDNYMDVITSTDPVSSSDFDSEFSPFGLKAGCTKITFTSNGTTYSTGNIILKWDGAEYISATPNSVSINITS